MVQWSLCVTWRSEMGEGKPGTADSDSEARGTHDSESLPSHMDFTPIFRNRFIDTSMQFSRSEKACIDPALRARQCRRCRQIPPHRIHS